jgi:broad specificity phosphatase PhoE
MSTLLLVRHGQAHAFDADSDRLTERGAAQAERLGEHLVSAGVSFDEVHVGTLVRQRRTAELVAKAFAAAGAAFPEPSVDPAWNEYDAHGILGTLMPELVSRDAAFGALFTDFQARAASPDRNRFFQRMFEVLMERWEKGAIEHPAVEPFAAFHGRVRTALDAILSRGGNRRVAVFTSGGPIGVCVQRVLDAPSHTALRLNFRVKNASLTEMVFSGGRVSLDRFNGVEHFDAELRTFR